MGADHKFQRRNPEHFIQGIGTLIHKSLDIDDKLITSENSHKVLSARGIYLKHDSGQTLLGLVGPIKARFIFIQRHNYTNDGTPYGKPVDGRGQTGDQVRVKFESDREITSYLTEAEYPLSDGRPWPFPRFLGENLTFEFASEQNETYPNFTIESVAMSSQFWDTLRELNNQNFRLAEDHETDKLYKQIFRLIHLRNSRQNLDLLHSLGVAHNDFGFRNVLVKGHNTFLIDFGDSQQYTNSSNVDVAKDNKFFAYETGLNGALLEILLPSTLSRANYQDREAYLSSLSAIDIDLVLQRLLAQTGLTEEIIGQMYEREKLRFKIFEGSKRQINLGDKELDSLLKGIEELKLTP